MFGVIDAGLFRDCSSQLDPSPGWCHVDGAALVLELRSAKHLFGHIGDHVFGYVHDHLIIGIGHVELQLGELRLMRPVDSLVPKVLSNLIDSLESSHKQPF